MYVKFRQPFFRNGRCEYEANQVLDVPEDIARTEIAKGFAMAVPAPKAEKGKAAEGESGKKGKAAE